MAIDTDQAELDATNAAIEAILNNGQSLGIREHSVEKARLETLYKRKDVLQRRIDRASRGGIRIRGATPAW